jgi:hypothetical protein
MVLRVLTRFGALVVHSTIGCFKLMVWMQSENVAFQATGKSEMGNHDDNAGAATNFAFRRLDFPAEF